MKKIKDEKEIFEYFNNSPKIQSEVLDSLNLSVFWRLYRNGKFVFLTKEINNKEIRIFMPSTISEGDVEWERYL